MSINIPNAIVNIASEIKITIELDKLGPRTKSNLVKYLRTGIVRGSTPVAEIAAYIHKANNEMPWMHITSWKLINYGFSKEMDDIIAVAVAIYKLSGHYAKAVETMRSDRYHWVLDSDDRSRMSEAEVARFNSALASLNGNGIHAMWNIPNFSIPASITNKNPLRVSDKVSKIVDDIESGAISHVTYYPTENLWRL